MSAADLKFPLGATALFLCALVLIAASRCTGPDPVYAAVSLPAPIVDPVPPLPVCTSADVQRHIIETERPGMGALEVEFWRRAIAAAAEKHRVPVDIYTALIAEESRFRGRSKSSKGARGAAQLMPIWTKEFDPYEIEPNLNKGAEVLAKYIADAGGLRDGLRRYNGGPKAARIKSTARYADSILARVYLATRVACPQQTRKV